MGSTFFPHFRCYAYLHRVIHQNTGLTDEQLLLQKTSEGDRQAFSELYTYYTPLLFRLLFPLTHASKEDTEEIIQEIFLKIWENRALLPAIQSFQAYVFRMARNMMVSQFRKKTVQKKATQALSLQGEPVTNRPADDILFIEYHAIAREAINRLPPRQRQIFELRTGEDLSLNEIAVHLGISLAAVKKQLYAAIDFIKDHLRRHAGWLTGLVLFFFPG